MIVKNKSSEINKIIESAPIECTSKEQEVNNSGFEGTTPEELYGFSPECGLTRSKDLAADDAYKDFFRDPKIMTAFTEYFDITDRFTRKAIIAMNESDQAGILTSLTSKLYDNIVSKVDDIDYGDIPLSKGDITKLSNYNKLRDCTELLRGILTEFKQNTSPIDEIASAIANIETRKDLFTRAYKLDVELPIIIYNNAVLTIISAISYMIATCIVFMKTPNNDSFEITLDKVAYSKTKGSMLYNNLKKFNKACNKKDIDKAVEHVLKHKVEKFSEGVAVGVGIAIAAAAGVLVILNIIPILREMVFFFYYTRMRVSDFFDIQADLLQMNAYNIQNNSEMDENKKEKTISKQLKIVELFRKISNKIAFTNKKAEVEATKEITNNTKKMKLSDVTDELPDSVSSALF